MSKVITFGKVETYDPSTQRLDAQWLPPGFTWKKGRVRTSGTNESRCNIDTREFDVTITPETAAKLVPDYVFSLEYDNSDPGSVKTVTKFAGQIIPAVSSASISAALTVPAGAAAQSPANTPSSPPAQ